MRQVALVEVHIISKCFKLILNHFYYTRCTASSGTRSQKVQDRCTDARLHCNGWHRPRCS